MSLVSRLKLGMIVWLLSPGFAKTLHEHLDSESSTLYWKDRLIIVDLMKAVLRMKGQFDVLFISGKGPFSHQEEFSKEIGWRLIN